MVISSLFPPARAKLQWRLRYELECTKELLRAGANVDAPLDNQDKTFSLQKQVEDLTREISSQSPSDGLNQSKVEFDACGIQSKQLIEELEEVKAQRNDDQRMLMSQVSQWQNAYQNRSEVREMTLEEALQKVDALQRKELLNCLKSFQRAWSLLHHTFTDQALFGGAHIEAFKDTAHQFAALHRRGDLAAGPGAYI